jgi:hypothetical protein
MSGTYAVTRAGDHGGTIAGFTEEEAAGYAAELERLLRPGPPFMVRDLLPELERRFPGGGSVWLGRQAYWRKGQRGTVAAGEPESFARWTPAAGPVPWFIGTGGASVFVRLDDGYASWWPAGWLETRET